MPVTVTEKDQGRTIIVHARDRLTKDDYDMFVPQIERRIEEHGKIRFVVRLDDLRGVDAAALWEDAKFDVKHFNDIERVAIVGDKAWMDWMATFCKPFTTAEVKFFQPDDADRAVDWASTTVHA